MINTYKQLTENVRNRVNPERLILQKSFTDELSSISYSDVLTYIRYAMKGVEPAYTQKSIQAGENVKTHLSELKDVEFKFQGSVMTNTHIKAYSDIDLLTISAKFYRWDRNDSEKYINQQEYKALLSFSSIAKLQAEQRNSRYDGNDLDDLRKIRLDSEQILSTKYHICDITKPKCIKVRNQNLNRDVDIVIANWYDDVRSIINNKGEQRGIEIYNKEKNWREKTDYPFHSIKRLNDKSSITNGRLKKMIRFIKNIRADSNLDINLSSFDINAICYDITASKYQILSFTELIPVIYSQLKTICTDSNYANNIVSVDEREYIFRYEPSKIENIRKVLSEVESIYMDLEKIATYA